MYSFESTKKLEYSVTMSGLILVAIHVVSTQAQCSGSYQIKNNVLLS
jgi:hypothetical protein